MQRSESITLKKGNHRQNTIIWLEFSGRPEWLTSLKTLKEIRYSRTNTCWYIPYDKSAYFHFKQLNIPFTISGTREEDKPSSIGEPAPQHDIPSISHEQKVRDSESPYTGLEVSDRHQDIKVRWTGKGFAIEVPYKLAYLKKLKDLEGGFWNAKVRKWYARSSAKNLEMIQKAFNIFTEAEYQKWFEVIMVSDYPCKIQLYRSPRFNEQVCVNVIGYGANHQIVKRISNRSYLKEEKIYLIPAIKDQIDQVIEGYTELGYKVENRLDTYLDKQQSATSSRVSKVAVLLQKLPENKYSFLKRYTDAMLAHNYSMSTIRDYAYKLSGLLEWCNAVDMQEITVDDVNRYMEHLVNNKRGFAVLNMVQSAVKVYAHKVSHEEWSDLSRLERPRKPRTLPSFLSEGEIVRLIDAIDNPKHLVIACTLYGSGIRLAEMLNIKISDIYWDRNQILIKSGKGNKDRMVTLSESSKSILDLYFHEYKPALYLIEGLTAGSQYSRSSISSMLKRAALKANISKRVTPHVLRHSYATHQMDIGIAIPKIQSLLGHKDIKTTLIYTHLTKKDLQNVPSPLDRVLSKRRKPDTE